MRLTTGNTIRFLLTAIPYQSVWTFLLVPLSLFFSACGSTNRTVYGTYYLQTDKSTSLTLQEDSSFVFKTIQQDSFFINQGTYHTTVKGIELNSLPQAYATRFSDSVSFFTGITSFSFWDSEGNSIDIRRIQINDAPSKAHYGNSLYYFEQDFKPADTIRFFFHGYGAISYPGDIKKISGNNAHRVILYAGYLPGLYRHALFTTRRNKLQCSTPGQHWKKKNK